LLKETSQLLGAPKGTAREISAKVECKGCLDLSRKRVRSGLDEEDLLLFNKKAESQWR